MSRRFSADRKPVGVFLRPYVRRENRLASTHIEVFTNLPLEYVSEIKLVLGPLHIKEHFLCVMRIVL